MLTEEQKTQGSPEWLELRRSKIGASDIAKIMGVSPYSTAYILWLEKTGRKVVEQTATMQAGNNKEETIRSWYEEKSGNVFFPTVLLSEEHPFAIASLDGITPDGKKILECKLCNKDVFSEAKKGVVVPFYMAQCQWQLMCCPEAKEVHYVCYNPSFDDYAVVIVKRDQRMINKMVKLAMVFHEEHLIKDIPPSLSEKDYLNIEEKEALDISKQLHETITEIADLTQKKDKLRESLLEYGDDGNFVCGQMKFTKNYMAIVDYKAAAIKNGIDLLEFTKNSIRWIARRT